MHTVQKRVYNKKEGWFHMPKEFVDEDFKRFATEFSKMPEPTIEEINKKKKNNFNDVGFWDDFIDEAERGALPFFTGYKELDDIKKRVGYYERHPERKNRQAFTDRMVNIIGEKTFA